MKITKQKLFAAACALLLAAGVFSCNSNQEFLTNNETTAIKGDVTELMNNVARDVSAKGPAVWLNYFEDSPEFSMANDGKLVYKDYPSAKTYVLNTLVNQMPQIKLQWSNIRIDALSNKLASVGAKFHEDLTDKNGQPTKVDGYFTAIAHQSTKGWLLLNLHWSSVKPGAN